jgi:hypothetical protein
MKSISARSSMECSWQFLSQVFLQENKVIDTTWPMKLKANGVRRARLVAHEFTVKQTPGVNYYPDLCSSLVACDASIKMFFVLATMAGYPIHMVDVQGVFINREFVNGEKI